MSHADVGAADAAFTTVTIVTTNNIITVIIHIDLNNNGDNNFINNY